MTALANVSNVPTLMLPTPQNYPTPQNHDSFGIHKIQSWAKSDPAIGIGSAAGIGIFTGVMMQTIGVSTRGTFAQAGGLGAAGVAAYAVAHQTGSRPAGMATAAAAGAGSMVLGQLLTPGAKPPSYLVAMGIFGGLLGLFVGGVSSKDATK